MTTRYCKRIFATFPKNFEAGRKFKQRKWSRLRTIKFETWNFHSMMGKLDEVLKEVNDRNFDLVALTATKKKKDTGYEVCEYIYRPIIIE